MLYAHAAGPSPSVTLMRTSRPERETSRFAALPMSALRNEEPGTATAVGINKSVWESLGASDRQVFEVVAACEYARSLAEFNANNALWLRKLRDEGSVKILKFDDSLLKGFLAISKDVVAEAGSGDDMSNPCGSLSPRISRLGWRSERSLH
jgi:hypothetical protein